MELQLVSKETAVLAKELGFNWIVDRYYIINEEKEAYKSYAQGRGDFNNRRTDQISAPEQELLAKWLRDIHKIHISVRAEENFELSQITFSCLVLEFDNDGKIMNNYDTGSFYHSYEEAMEDALLYCLKQIK